MKAALLTLGCALLLGLLFATRLLGLYSHQVLAVALLFSTLWAVPRRLFLAWRARAVLGWKEGLTPHLVARVAFWTVLTAAGVIIFPRSAELTPLAFVLLGLGAFRVALEGVQARDALPGVSAVMAVGALVLGFDLVRVVWPMPHADIVIEPPFSGTWRVLQGGRSPLVSHHLSAYNQVWALDLLPVDASDQIFVHDEEGNAMWQCWEKPLFSPVTGTVAAARGDLPDAEGGHLVDDAALAAGNHVVLHDDRGFYVLLAHLRQGSVTVSVGDRVNAGQVLGRCGNSGNTTAPHLHLQVMDHADLWDPENRSLPFTFQTGGRALSRNTTVRGLDPASGGTAPGASVGQ